MKIINRMRDMIAYFFLFFVLLFASKVLRNFILEALNVYSQIAGQMIEQFQHQNKKPNLTIIEDNNDSI